MQSKIAALFNNIAPHYDFLNHLLSFNIDKRWRREAVKNHIFSHTQKVLDIACGTGDFAIEVHRAGAQQVIGIDISEQMGEIGKKKMLQKQLCDCIDLRVGDCAAMTFHNEEFDAITIAYGVRNFESRQKSLQEIYRVLKNGGETIILEFSTPVAFPMRQLYHFYFKKILPCMGGWISGNKKAYTYLPESVYAFPSRDCFINEIKNAGFKNVTSKIMTCGISTVYYAIK